MWKLILLPLFCGNIVTAIGYKICAPSSINDDICNALKKGDSDVKCERVLDGTDCALKLIKNEVDFGVLTAEELFLAYQFYPNEIRLLFELRHSEKDAEEFKYQMVALVPFTHNDTGDNNIDSLKGGGLCHPGFINTQNLNDGVLKHFERSVYGSECNKDVTDAENELINLKNFFGKSCRPGEWVPDKTLDETLKKKYPELCSLCNNNGKCDYADSSNHGHQGAMKCLKEGQGKVAFVALSYARNFVDKFSSKVPLFQMLCPNRTVKNFETGNPCSWVKQRWNVIAAREDRSKDLEEKLRLWLSGFGNDWTIPLKKIISGDDLVHRNLPEQFKEPGYYLSQDVPVYNKCGKDIGWCTINEIENNKCKWVATEASVLGITPKISCEQASSTFECFRSIKKSETDLMTIDSNYGYLVRKAYSLSTLLYSDTDNDKSKVVLAVVKDSPSPKIKSLQDLKGKRACFPEYGGISWMSFLKVVRDNELVSDSKSCDYKKIASEIWSEACVPGINDNEHSLLQRSSKADSSSLCSLCSKYFCEANENNVFFQDNGAFRCIETDVADIAFIKPKNLNDSTGLVNQDQYRVLCRNGSLAINTGFDVDDACAWSVAIDSEVVSRKSNSDVDHMNMALALLKLDNWLGYKVQPAIHIYDKFNDTENLLFKDSTVGLVSTTSSISSVRAYKELMVDAEKCSSASIRVISLSILLMSIILNRIL